MPQNLSSKQNIHPKIVRVPWIQALSIGLLVRDPPMSPNCYIAFYSWERHVTL